MSASPTASTRVLALLASLLVVSAGACSAGTTPTSGTVTVTVTEGAGATSPRGTPAPSGPRASAPLPTALAVGHQRGAPHSYAAAKARFDKARVDGAIHGTFRSPSGNIRCDVSNSATIAECVLAAGLVKVPADLCPSTGAERVRGVELTAVGAFPVCKGTVSSAAHAPKLPYGSRTVVPGSPFTCLSEEAGVTCLDTDYQRGFFLAKGTFVTF